MRNFMPKRHAASLLTAALLAVTMAGCTDFLKVDNPGAIQEANVNNPAYAQLLVNGVIADYQNAFSGVALYSAIFTDELSNWHGFFENVDIDNRNVSNNNGTYTGLVYTRLQSARFLADSTASFLKEFEKDTVSRDPRLARVLDYAGYSYLLLGEQMCASPIGIGPSYSPDQLDSIAVVRFKAAMDAANAAKAYWGTLTTSAAKANAAAADSLLTLANVGAARASLDLGKTADAVNYASTVPAGFAFNAYYSSNSSTQYNQYWSMLSGGGNAEAAGISYTPFEAITNDPRIPRPTSLEQTQQGKALVPNSPLMFSTYNGTTTGADFAKDASITFASGLEAQYIIAEVQGVNATNLAFLNSRRAIGGDTAYAATVDDSTFRASLRDQRSRDLYLAGYRMGDLRRYQKLYKLDLWQHGAYQSPVTAPATFGDETCWPIPLSELNGNPQAKTP